MDSCFSWKNFEEFINTANQECNWLVLRNFEYLPNNFFGNDKDVDILCENIDDFTRIMKLRKRSWGIAAYETTIDNKIVPFDVRFLGDNYYDKLWQYKMLKNKIFSNENVPRMNDEDYFFSLIYHSKIQKYEVKEIYIDRLCEIAKTLDIKNFDTKSIHDNKFVANLLSQFMIKNFYNFSTPIDTEIPKNLVFFKELDDYVKTGVSFKIPREVMLSKKTPKIITKIIPKNIKNFIKKVL